MAPGPRDAPSGLDEVDAVVDAPARSSARRLGGDVSLRVLARVASAALQAATLLLLARELGPVEFGVLAVFAATGTVLSSVACLGASTRVLRLRAEDDQDALLAGLFWLQAAGSLVVVIGMGVAALLTGDPAPAAVGAVLAFSDQQMEFRVAHLSGQVRPTAASVTILVQRGLPLVAVALALAAGVGVLVPTVVALVLVTAAALVPAPARHVSARSLLATVRTSLGYWFSALVGNLRQLEPAVVGSGGGVAAAGLYGIAARVSNPLTIVVTSLQAVAVPEMARTEDPAQFRRLFRLLLGVATLYAALLVAGSPLVAHLFLLVVGERYEGARVLVVVLVIAAGLSAISQALQARLLAVGRPATAGGVIGGATVVGLVLLAVTSATDPAYLWVAPLTTQSLILVVLALVPVRGPSGCRAADG